MSDVKRTCLMLSDLQSGAQTVEYVLWEDYVKLSTEAVRLRDALGKLVYKDGPNYYAAVYGDSDVTDIVESVLDWP